MSDSVVHHEYVAGFAAYRAARNVGAPLPSMLREFFDAEHGARADLLRRNPTQDATLMMRDRLERLLREETDKVELWVRFSGIPWMACDKTPNCPGTLLFEDAPFFMLGKCVLCGKEAKCARLVTSWDGWGKEVGSRSKVTCKKCMNCPNCGKNFAEGNVASDEEWAKEDAERKAQSDV